MAQTRSQINIRADNELLEAVSEIRRSTPGLRLPTVTDVIRSAILEKRDRLKGNVPENNARDAK
jgi:hypothetical protein